MDWLFYIAKVHLNYSRSDFFDSTFKEITKLWNMHKKYFNSKEEESSSNSNVMNIEDFPF